MKRLSREEMQRGMERAAGSLPSVNRSATARRMEELAAATRPRAGRNWKRFGLKLGASALGLAMAAGAVDYGTQQLVNRMGKSNYSEVGQTRRLPEVFYSSQKQFELLKRWKRGESETLKAWEARMAGEKLSFKRGEPYEHPFSTLARKVKFVRKNGQIGAVPIESLQDWDARVKQAHDNLEEALYFDSLQKREGESKDDWVARVRDAETKRAEDELARRYKKLGIAPVDATSKATLLRLAATSRPNEDIGRQPDGGVIIDRAPDGGQVEATPQATVEEGNEVPLFEIMREQGKTLKEKLAAFRQRTGRTEAFAPSWTRVPAENRDHFKIMPAYHAIDEQVPEDEEIKPNEVARDAEHHLMKAISDIDSGNKEYAAAEFAEAIRLGKKLTPEEEQKAREVLPSAAEEDQQLLRIALEKWHPRLQANTNSQSALKKIQKADGGSDTDGGTNAGATEEELEE